MDDPAAAVASLRESTDVDVADLTTELTADEWTRNYDDGTVWVGGIVLSPARDRVALVRNWWSGDQWILPGGGVESDDSSLEGALRREVREETGLAVTIEEPLLIQAQTYVNVDAPEHTFEGRFVLFRAVAEGTTFADDPGEDADEIVAVRWFDHVPESIFNHADRIRDALG